MTAVAATFADAHSFDGPLLTCGSLRHVGSTIALVSGSAAFVVVTGLTATLASAWLFATALNSHSPNPIGMSAPATVIAGQAPAMGTRAGVPADLSLDAKVARARALAVELASLAPPAPQAVAQAQPQPSQPAALHLASQPATPNSVVPPIAVPLPPKRASIAAVAAEHAADVPLPRPGPAPKQEAAPEPAPAKAPAPVQVATASPAPEPAPAKPVVVAPSRPSTKALADVDGRTAVYDISARTVYMPGGARLEAHSGLGEKMDDPRYIHVKMRGATPPNVYTLTMREKLFHGVRAIRLNPVDPGKMHGRDGILAHTYMLGPNGQSNGCVSFRDYDKFLRAFLDGEVDRMVVVASLDGAPPAHVARTGRAPAGRYASVEPFDRAKGAW